MIPYDPDLAPTLQGSDKQQRKGQHDTKQQKQVDVYPNAVMIQNQSPNPWIPCGSYILNCFQCIPTSHDFSMMIRIIQDHASSSSKVDVAGVPPPRQDRLSALQNGHGDTTRETRIQQQWINYKMRYITTTYIIKQSLMRTFQPQNVM